MAKKNVIENGLGTENLMLFGKDLLSLDFIFNHYHFDDRIKFFLKKKYGDADYELKEWLSIIRAEKLDIEKIK